MRAIEAFELESFEQVPAGGEAVLLRVAGRWSAAKPPSAALLIDDGRRAHALRALPAPESPTRATSSLWQAAFAADSELIDARSAFALRAGGGELVDLPAPRARPRPIPAPPLVEPEREPQPDATLSEARRQAMLFLQSRLEAEQAAHAATQARAASAENAFAEEQAALREAQQRIEEHRAAVALLDGALESQLESAIAADLEIETLEEERESETQTILRLVRQARREESSAPSPFPRWEKTKRLAARWAASLGAPGERAEEANGSDPAELDASAR